MKKKEKQHIVFLTIDEIMALDVIAQSIIENGGLVQWKTPVSKEWLDDLKSAHEKLDKKVGEIGGRE